MCYAQQYSHSAQYTWGDNDIREARLTFQLQANEVGVAQVFQKDAVRGAGLEIERDVSTGLALEGGKVQVGWRGGEGRSVPVVVCKEKRNKGKTDTFYRFTVEKSILKEDQLCLQHSWFIV